FDVVLTVCSVAERSGTYTNVEGRVQRFLKAYDAPDGARPEWWIASMIAGALGKPMHFAGARDVLQAISEFVPLYQGCSPSSVGDEGVATRAVAAETPALQGPGNKATQG
ncbi:MAG: hypothetical protein FJX72_17090, partial [Armatimonadetes bacterium]|nr:hypothetical protein [Armatimonadota bacterium]